MNELGIGLLWLALQITVLVSAGLALIGVAGRRSPMAGTMTARTSVIAVLILTALSFLPLPPWSAWRLPDHVPLANQAVANTARPASVPVSADTNPEQSGLSLARLDWLVRHFQDQATGVPLGLHGKWHWPALLAVVVVTGTGLALMRLLVTLWTMRRGRHGSRPVWDSDVLALVEEIRPGLGVKSQVRVRESPGLTTAAAVGWRKPLLLLPADWRGWTTVQRRAAIAHELAHIARGDYAAWLAARFCVALYFWHPLVRLLARQLQLQQELAADAVAARLTGARTAYLRALAELALKIDGGVHGWPAPAFLSRPGTLIRRIAMLRVMDDSDRSTSRLGRWGTMSLLGVLTLTASALRGPADEPHGVTSVKPSTPQIAPFDLSLLVPAADADGVYGVRPAALLKRPGAERLVKVINQQIGAGTALLGLGQPGIHIEDVDQLMGRVYFKGKNKTGKRQLMLSANVLRTTRDIDWVKLRDQCTLKLTQHHLQGETYVSFAMPPMLAGIVGPDSRGYLWAADARTLVFDTEDNIRMLIAAKITRAPVAAPAYTAGWERVNRCLIALAYDNTGQRLAHKTMTPQEIEHALADRSKPDYFAARLYQQFSALVMGSDGEDDISLHLQLSAETPATAARMARECKALVATAKRKLEQEKPPKDADSLALAGVQLYRRLLDHAAVQCAGMLVTVHTKADSGLNSLLQFYMRQMMPDVP